MTNAVNQPANRKRPLRYARDVLACWTLFFVGNLCASITWEHYYGHAVAPGHHYGDPPTAVSSHRIRTEIYSAMPLLMANHDAPEVAPVACATDLHSVAPTSPRMIPLATDGAKRVEGLSACPSGMQLVDGMHCPVLGHYCREYLSVGRDRCKVYAPEGRCVGVPSHLRFCIDEFEYPNRAGVKPLVAVNFAQAEEHCRSEGKRLCTSVEWELACEGPNHYPYPNGYVRDASACNIDRPTIQANNAAYANPETRDAEIARVDQREASGARPQCVSGYGVFDMSGNVDEWVLNEEGFYNRPPYRSALKGGYWGHVRNRCRPTTTDHNEWHNGYQIGFRCCAGTNQENLPPTNRSDTSTAAQRLVAFEGGERR